MKINSSTASDLPEEAAYSGKRKYNSITVDGQEIDFSGGFTDLHTSSNQAILDGYGFDREANRTAIETVASIRNSVQKACAADELHPFTHSRNK